MLNLYNKHFIAVVLLLILSGCGGGGGGSNVKTVTEKSTDIPSATVNTPAKIAAENIEPGLKQDYDKALTAIKEGDEARAEALLRRVSMADPNLSGPYVNLGLLKYRAGRMEDAEAQFQKALKVNPRSAVSYNHLGIISRNKGAFKEAREYYQKALDIDPNYAYAHLNFGILLDIYIGELEQALDHYEKFQQFSFAEDKDVKKWIIDIKRRIEKKNK